MAEAPITMTCEQLTELLRPMMQQHLQARGWVLYTAGQTVGTHPH